MKTTNRCSTAKISYLPNKTKNRSIKNNKPKQTLQKYNVDKQTKQGSTRIRSADILVIFFFIKLLKYVDWR